MNDVWKGRLVGATSRYGEHAPMVAVCCNACRTCVSTNAVGIVFAAAGAVAAGVWAAAKRLGRG